MSSSFSLFLSLLFLSLFWSSFASSSIGSKGFSRRSILREISNYDDRSDKHVEKPDFAVVLNATNFDAVLNNTPATYAIVEFYAHWCPACRNYKPHYEKVARLFNGVDAIHPGIILMTRIDCALKINTVLCDKFSISHYPDLLWGPPPKFVAATWETKQKNSEIRRIDDGRTADRLLYWINKQIGSSYGLDDEKCENDHLPANASHRGQIVQAVYDVAEATTTAFNIIFKHKVKNILSQQNWF